MRPESCAPVQSARLALAKGYEVHTEFEKGPDEPYSGQGDLDFDTLANMVEWNNVAALGGSIDVLTTATRARFRAIEW